MPLVGRHADDPNQGHMGVGAKHGMLGFESSSHRSGRVLDELIWFLLVGC